MATKTVVKQQIRSFAFVWTLITFTIGVAVFFAIYMTYNPTNEALAASNQSIGLPVNDAPNTANETPPAQNNISAAAANPQQRNLEEAQASPIAVTPLSALGGNNQQQPITTPEPSPMETRDQFFPAIQVQYSITLDEEIQRGWMNDVQGLGVQWYKQQIRWDEIEVTPGEFVWDKLDLSLPIAEEYGFNVMISVVAAPDWAAEPVPQWVIDRGITEELERPPANYNDLANFLTAMLNRYPGQIHGIEIWNETNLDREWLSSGGVSAANYVDMLSVAYNTIKNIDPGIIVISAAPAPTGGLVQDGIVRAIDDFDYVDQLINSGVMNYMDCFGVHHNGYNVSPDYTWDQVPPDPNANFRGPFDDPHHSYSFRSTLQTYYNKLAVAAGNAGLPDPRLCITEFGWPSVEELDGYPAGFEFALDNTLEEQAEFTVKALEFMNNEGYVWIASIWNLNYAPQIGWDTSSDNTPYSLISPDFSKRPAYTAAAQWIAENLNN